MVNFVYRNHIYAWPEFSRSYPDLIKLCTAITKKNWNEYSSYLTLIITKDMWKKNDDDIYGVNIPFFTNPRYFRLVYEAPRHVIFLKEKTNELNIAAYYESDESNTLLKTYINRSEIPDILYFIFKFDIDESRGIYKFVEFIEYYKPIKVSYRLPNGNKITLRRL